MSWGASSEERLEGFPSPRHLVKVRASQINGCAFCLDMHWLDARADGESEARLYSLDAWRESPLGMPYNSKRPEGRDIGKGVWDPDDRRILTPKNYGWGYGVNFRALLARLTGR